MKPCPPATNTEEKASPNWRCQVALVSAVMMRDVRSSTTLLPCGLTLMNPSRSLPKGRNAWDSWLTTSTPSVPSRVMAGDTWYCAFTLPVKCFVSCLLVRCMSSRTVPNEATPKGFPGPLHPPSPVGVEDARGVMHDARSGCPKMALVAGA